LNTEIITNLHATCAKSKDLRIMNIIIYYHYNMLFTYVFSITHYWRTDSTKQSSSW